MAKIGVLKKITAFATVVALIVCFAVSAAAADFSVSTSTTYTNGTADVSVIATVTGLDNGTNVTYYAKNGETVVHIDQEQVAEGSAVFEFNTDADNLESAVLIGYTNNAGAAETTTIEGYTITLNGVRKVIPTEAKTVNFTGVDLGAEKAYVRTDVKTGTATIASAEYDAGNLSVTFTSITTDVELEVVTEDAPEGTPTAVIDILDAAATTVADDGEGNFKIDGVFIDGVEIKDAETVKKANADAIGNRKLTVVGNAMNATEFGILVSKTAINTKIYTAAQFEAIDADKYAAIGAADAETGSFAIQLIDTNNDAATADFVVKGQAYYTAVYAKSGANYAVVANNGPVTAN